MFAVREDREGRRGPSQGRRRQADSRRRRFLERQPVRDAGGENPFAPAATTTSGGRLGAADDGVAMREAAAAKLAAARAERAAANARAASFEVPSSPPETPPPMHSPGTLPPEVNVPVSPPVSSPAGDGPDAVSPLTALALGQFTPSPSVARSTSGLVPIRHRLSVSAGRVSARLSERRRRSRRLRRRRRASRTAISCGPTRRGRSVSRLRRRRPRSSGGSERRGGESFFFSNFGFGILTAASGV